MLSSVANAEKKYSGVMCTQRKIQELFNVLEKGKDKKRKAYELRTKTQSVKNMSQRGKVEVSD